MADIQGFLQSSEEEESNAIKIETSADGNGTDISAMSITLGDSFTVYAIERDSEGNYVSNIEVSWVLVGSNGNLNVLMGGKAAEFTGGAAGAGQIKVTYGSIQKIIDVSVSGNAAPTFSFVEPLGSNDMVADSSSTNITWTDDDSDSDASISFYYKTSNTGSCSSGTAITTGISEDDGTDSYSWSPTGLAQDNYYICAVIDDGTNPAVEVHSDPIMVTKHCTWTGATNTDWATASNWFDCAGAVPTATDYAVILSSPSNQPVVSATTTIAGIGDANVGGGTVTINSGVILNIDTNSSIQSDITFQGATAGCSNCDLNFVRQNSFILNNATLTLLTGVHIDTTATYSHISVGNGVTPGHLVAQGGGTWSEWPRIYTNYANGFRGFIIEGTASNPSTVNVDGLSFQTMDSNNNSHVTRAFDFVNYYSILNLDNIALGTEHTNHAGGYSFVRLDNCTNATIIDTSWTGINFTQAFGNSGYNVEAGTCTTGVPGTWVTVSGSGRGFGSVYEEDPNNLIDWTNGAQFTCTWTGATDTN
ncbi:MAG: Ser-Thr-rich GPI-anchored membrane family protein [Bdellovibrionales bacterium]